MTPEEYREMMLKHDLLTTPDGQLNFRYGCCCAWILTHEERGPQFEEPILN